MLNPLYIKYIPDDKKEECQYKLLVDMFYFYYGIKPSENQKITCVDGCMLILDSGEPPARANQHIKGIKHLFFVLI